MIYFKVKLQLTFGNNKNYSSITVSFHINFKLKFRKNKCYHEMRTAQTYPITSLLPKPLKQSLVDVTSFSISNSPYSRTVPFKRTSNFGSVFKHRLDRRIHETKIPDTR